MFNVTLIFSKKNRIKAAKQAKHKRVKARKKVCRTVRLKRAHFVVTWKVCSTITNKSGEYMFVGCWNRYRMCEWMNCCGCSRWPARPLGCAVVCLYSSIRHLRNGAAIVHLYWVSKCIVGENDFMMATLLKSATATHYERSAAGASQRLAPPCPASLRLLVASPASSLCFAEHL